MCNFATSDNFVASAFVVSGSQVELCSIRVFYQRSEWRPARLEARERK